MTAAERNYAVTDQEPECLGCCHEWKALLAGALCESCVLVLRLMLQPLKLVRNIERVREAAAGRTARDSSVCVSGSPVVTEHPEQYLQAKPRAAHVVASVESLAAGTCHPELKPIERGALHRGPPAGVQMT
ncbi:hypothetical protein ABBQ38_004500 [Trebouxia sp. C0009 RCD-2024]